MPRDLMQELSRRPLLCDGAMGTQLLAAGMPPGSAGELWNVERPDAVEMIHGRYRAAGCDLITTNSFGGTRATLAKHHLEKRVAELNTAAAKVARKAAGETGFVLGDIGPFGGFLEPYGDSLPEQVTPMFAEQAAALREGGADAFIVETMVDPAEMALAIAAGKAAGLPVIATYAFGKTPAGFRTLMGTTVEGAIKAAFDAGADIAGANCGTGLSLEDYLRLAEEIARAAGKSRTILQPNAGAPRHDGARTIYDATPAQMSELVPRLLAMGFSIIGGCCGTTPEHLKAMATVMRK